MTNQKPTCGFAWRGYIRESVLPKKKIEKNSQKQIIRGMIDWGTKKIPRASNNPPSPKKKFLQKSNPKKSHAELLRIKNIANVCFCLFIIPSTSGGRSNNTRDTRSPRTFWVPQKNPYLNQATQKILAKSSYQKKTRIENFKPKKILRSSLSLEIKSTFLGHRVASFIVTKRGHGKIKAVVL